MYDFLKRLGIQETNPVGAQNQGWLKEVIVTLSSRFTDEPQVEPLVILAQGDFPIDQWQACLLWHTAIVDELYFRFGTEWLFHEYQEGTYLMRTEDVMPFVARITKGRISREGELSEYGLRRAARDLLRMAADFGLLNGKAARRFTTYHLSEACFLYVAHAIAENETNAQRIIDSPYWRLFLMGPQDVERELLNLHQYRKVHYESAGSIVQLELPYNSLVEYAKGLVA